MTYQDNPTASAPKQRSPWKALLSLITEPTATFQAFGGRVPVAPGYLVAMLFGLAGVLLALPVTLKMMEKVLAATPGYTPQMLTVTRWSGIGGGIFVALAGPWLAGLVVSLFATFFGQFQEERATFPSYLGMVGYARLPLSLNALLNGILVLALDGRVQQVNLSLSILTPGASLFLKTLLGTITPFSVWYYWLLALGFGALHRGKPSKGLWLVVTIFVLSFLLTYGLAALGSKFAPQM